MRPAFYAAVLAFATLAPPPAVAQRSEAAVEATFVRGLTRAYLGDHEAAASLYLQVLAERPDDAGVLAALAEAYGALDRPADALFYAERAAAEAPGQPAAWRLVAEWRHHAGNTAGALEAMVRLDALGAADVDDLGTLAQLHALNDDDRAALDAYDRLFDRSSGRPSDWTRMLAAARRTGDTDATLRALRRLDALAPDNPAFAREIPSVLEAAGRPDEAAAARTAFAKRFPGEVGPAGGAPAVAAETAGAGDAADAAPPSLDAAHDLGRRHLLSGNAADALPHLRRVAAEDPSRLAAWEDLVEALRLLGEANAALAAADDAELLFPGHPVPLLMRAHTLQTQGATSPAQAAYQAALDGAALLGETPEALAWKGQALAGLERWDEAAVTLERALAASNEDPRLLERLGDVEAARGNAAAARRHWSAALNLAPGRPSLLEKLAP